MTDFLKKTARVAFGLFLCAIGSYLSIQANVGLAPWGAFNIGVAAATGLTYGNVSIITALLVILVDVALKEKIGMGTLMDSILMGVYVDLLIRLDPLPLCTNYGLGILVLLLGQVAICLGSYYYISAGLSCGPRDSLMVALDKRLTKVPIGAVRGLIETGALLVGWLFGAKVGLGTIIAVFGISSILQLTFSIFRFDPKSVDHEDILTSFRNLKAELAKRLAGEDKGEGAIAPKKAGAEPLSANGLSPLPAGIAPEGASLPGQGKDQIFP